jgi:hypothetical protein
VSSQQQQRTPAVMLVSLTPAFSVINWDLCYAAYLNEQVFVFTHSPAACSIHAGTMVGSCGHSRVLAAHSTPALPITRLSFDNW